MKPIDRTKAPAVHDIDRMSLRTPELTVLPGGVRLMTLSGGDDDVCRLSVIIDGGIGDIMPPHAASLIAKLLSEGAAGMSSTDIADKLDYNGAWYRGNAHQHHIVPTLYTLCRRFDAVFPVFMKMLTAPTFPEKETAIAVEVMARQLEVEREKVKYYADREATLLIKGDGHPMAREPQPDEIRAITPAVLSDIYSRMLNPANITVCMAGKLSPGMVDTVAHAFTHLDPTPEGVKVEIVPNSPKPRCRVEIDRKEARQSAVVAVMPALPRSHPDYIALRFAVMALGGYFGSRLMTNVREDKGYTYGITASLIGEPEGGYVKIESQCDPRYTEPMIEEIKREMTRMSTAPLSSHELERVKRNYMTTLTSRLESPMSMMDERISTILVGTPEDYFDRQQLALSSLTPEIVTDVSRKYLDPQGLSWVIAGPNDYQ